MSRKSSALAGTALGLLMAASPFAAHAFVIPAPLPGKNAKEVRGESSVPFILIQNEEELTEEERRQQQQENQQQEGQQKSQGRGAEAEEEPPAEQPAAEPEPAPEPTPEPAPEPAPQAEEEPPTPEPEAPAAEEPEQPAPEQPEGESEPAPRAEEPPAEPETEMPAPEEPEAPADAGEDEPAQAEEPAPQPSEEVPPAEAEQPAEDEEAPADAEEPVEENQPAEGEEPAEDQRPPEGEEAPADEQEPAAEEQPAEGEEPAEPGQPAEGEDAPAGDAQEPADEEQPAQGEEPVESEQPAEAEEAPADEETTGEGRPEDAAPILDSQKVPGAAEPEGEAPEDEEAQQPAEEEQADEQPAEAAPPPESDAAAQRGLIDPAEIEVEIEQVTEEQGERIELGESREERRQGRRELRQRREDAEVIQEFEDNRTIIQINNQIFIDSPDYDRIIHDDDEVYYERLPRDRYREVVTRPNGVRVVTIYNRYGDVVRRVRVAPDGRRYVLVYVPDRDLDLSVRFQDPALGLPPLRLTIPREEYILEAVADYDPDRYYTFLDQPPVEPVQRIYSLEEVKYSARVRDIVRRVDLDTIEFEFGSAEIEESEIAELEAIADAILRFLDENPGETFLIEGHTDAVGSENANLALSDRRAGAVARALTNVFGVPPENLATQGYGEQYLKINTQDRERENRRVAIRRITPLVTPVASAE